jgi:hypothetical protein
LRPELFELNEESSWKSFLAEQGYVVIADVLPVEDVHRALELLLHDLQGFTPELKNLDEVREWHLPPTPAENDLRLGAGLCLRL